MTGKLVTIEGIDGSGKSTLAKQLHDINHIGGFENTAKTKEPTDDDIGKLLRTHLREDRFSTLSELHLFIANHAEHIEQTIRPALTEDKLVICDRYIDSRCAYQAPKMEDFVSNPLEYIYDLHQPWTVTPDITILLETDPEIAVDRLHTKEKFETKSQLETIQQNYRELANRHQDRFHVVDANGTETETLTSAIEIIEKDSRRM